VEIPAEQTAISVNQVATTVQAGTIHSDIYSVAAELPKSFNRNFN
jgi:hypothetical protein